MVLFVLFFGCSQQVDATPKEVNLFPLFSDTEETPRITRITRITSVTQPEVNRDAETQKEMVSGGSSSNQEEITNSKNITTRIFPRKGVKRNNCIKKFVYRVIYNYFFAIPVCKKRKGCREKFMSVNFSNGETSAIRYDCYKWYQACFDSIYYYIYSIILTWVNKLEKEGGT